MHFSLAGNGQISIDFFELLRDIEEGFSIFTWRLFYEGGLVDLETLSISGIGSESQAPFCFNAPAGDYEFRVTYETNQLDVSEIESCCPSSLQDTLNGGDEWSVRLTVRCIGDIDQDGDVDVVDFLALLGAWGPCPPEPAECPADLNGDGTVNVVDFMILLGNWGLCCPFEAVGTESVPR
ncbi:MAG: dockerin type I domain-containing protein [Planctomycetota bacterium]